MGRSTTCRSRTSLSATSIAFTLAAFAVTWIIAGCGNTTPGDEPVPNFLGAPVYGHAMPSGNAPWSWPKLVDVAKNALAVFVIAVGTAPRILRVRKKLYVTTARAKGLRESRVISYPVAFNPLVSPSAGRCRLWSAAR